VIEYYAAMTEEELARVTYGIDRGVITPVSGSDGEQHDFSDVQKARIKKKERRKKHYQKQMAKRQRGSKRRRKANSAISCSSRYIANVRSDFAHKASRALVDSGHEVFVFEDLKVGNMTRKAAPKKDSSGRYIKNGAKAKAGLNRAILNSAWGKVRQYTAYKARRANKLVIDVQPQYTSQECSRCSHTHPDNRRTQAVFECQNCGFTTNADTNAAVVIKQRGIGDLRAGRITVKERKSVMRLKKSAVLGQELAEVTHGEKDIRRLQGVSLQTHPSLNRETPTTTELSV
jgi:putative transposase